MGWLPINDSHDIKESLFPRFCYLLSFPQSGNHMAAWKHQTSFFTFCGIYQTNIQLHRKQFSQSVLSATYAAIWRHLQEHLHLMCLPFSCSCNYYIHFFFCSSLCYFPFYSTLSSSHSPTLFPNSYWFVFVSYPQTLSSFPVLCFSHSSSHVNNFFKKNQT